MPRDLDQYRTELEQFIGHVVEGVSYFEIDYEALGGRPGPLYLRSVGHSLDFGLDLRLKGQPPLGLFWDAGFVQYDLGYAPESVASVFPNARHWDVSGVAPWSSILGARIEGIELWDAEFDGVRYPQDLRISFSAGPDVFVSSAELHPNRDEVWFTADNIVVCWTDDAARRWGLGPSRTGQV